MDPRFIGPNAVWASIAQAFMIMLGYSAACIAAAVFAAVAVIHLDIVAVYTSWPAAIDALTFIGATSATALVGGFWASAAAVVITEGMKLRGPVAYLVAGSIVGLLTALPVAAVLNGAPHDAVSWGLVQLSAASGAVGGFVYWLIAGRNAGRWMELPWFEENRR